MTTTSMNVGQDPDGLDYDQMPLGRKLQELAWRLDLWAVSNFVDDDADLGEIFDALEALATEEGAKP
jgi:hypothetical protein